MSLSLERQNAESFDLWSWDIQGLDGAFGGGTDLEFSFTGEKRECIKVEQSKCSCPIQHKFAMINFSYFLCHFPSQKCN